MFRHTNILVDVILKTFQNIHLIKESGVNMLQREKNLNVNYQSMWV